MSLLSVKIGPNAPEQVNVVIEIPRGSTNKYELDVETGVMKLDRVLYSPLFYPFDYGFVPQTHYLDGDPLDVLVLLTHPTFPGCVIEAAPIGVLYMTDEKGPDEKILAVALKDPRFGYRTRLDQLNEHTLKEVRRLLRGLQATRREVGRNSGLERPRRSHQSHRVLSNRSG